jgi:hypothetical protein
MANSSDQFGRIFDNFVRRPRADEAAIRDACRTLSLEPPPDYIAAMQYTDGGEGFIRQSYLHLYSVGELLRLNAAYRVDEFAPGIVIFGSTGGGEAFGFDKRQTLVEIVEMPFIPMVCRDLKRLGRTFTEFLQALRAADLGAGSTLPQINPAAIGKEVHEVHPVVFGGSPTDPKNKVLLTPEQHAEYCVWWNRLYYKLTHGEAKGSRSSERQSP